MLALLDEFESDPVAYATAYGQRTGRCFACDLRLEDDTSIGLGYGRVCAGHYSLPYGKRAAREDGRHAVREGEPARGSGGVICGGCGAECAAPAFPLVPVRERSSPAVSYPSLAEGRTLMLCLKMKPRSWDRPGTSRIMIGDNIIVTIVEVKGGTVIVGVDAPRDIVVARENLLSLAEVDRIEKAAKGE